MGLLFGACLALALLSLTVFGGTQVQANPPSTPHGDGVHPGGGNGGLDNSGHTPHPKPQPPPPPPPPDDPPDNPPPDDPPPDKQPSTGGGSPPSTPTAPGTSSVAGVSTSGHSGSHSHGTASPGSVVVKPHTNPATDHHKAKATKAAKAAKATPAGSPPPAVEASRGNPDRSTFADRLLS